MRSETELASMNELRGQLVDSDTGRLVVARLEIARTLWEQSVGLMGRRGLHEDDGLLILRCNSIHTCFVKFKIDAVFLDAELRVVRVCPNLAPWRIAGPICGAKSTLELPAGTVRQKQITVGQRLLLKPSVAPTDRLP